MLEVLTHPLGSPRPVFLLPDRYPRLEFVDDVAPGGKRFLTMPGANGNGDTCLPYLE